MRNDRLDPELLKGTKLPKPEVEIIVDGDSVLKPGMKTYFVRLDDSGETKKEVHAGKTVFGSVCTCDMVCTCENVCSCVSYVSCSCQSYQTCSCNSQGYYSCSCNKVCSCVPVH